MALNAKQVETLTKAGKHYDGDGLYLLVSKAGGKSWVYRYQLNGKRREMGLGAYPAATLKAARIAASNARTLRLQGIDPLDEREAAQEQQKAQQAASKAKAVTFESVALDYLQEHGRNWTPKWQSDCLSRLKRYALPTIGKLPPTEIETEHILSVLKPIWGTKPKLANELRGHIESILDAAKALELRTGENPARWGGHLDNLLSRTDKKRAKQPKHLPAMPWKDVPAFMQRLTGIEGRDAAALRLVILTGARYGMVRFAAWNEFDLEAGIWSLAAPRMKGKKAFAVPLSRQAIELVQLLPRIDNSPYLFPGTGAKTGAMNQGATMHLLRSMRHGDITTHGFRTSFRTWASECTNYPRDVCELSLAHDDRGATEAAYSRSDLFDKRIPLMQDWCDYATTAPNEKVVQGAFRKKESS